MVWDTGTYSVDGDNPVKAYHSGKLHLHLSGKKLKGEWVLVRTNQENNWYIIKSGDDAKPVSKKRDNQSALTERTMEKIAEDRSAVWK